MNYEQTLSCLCALSGPSGFEEKVARAAEEVIASGGLVPGEKLAPIYHRLSQAERERLERNG